MEPSPGGTPQQAGQSPTRVSVGGGFFTDPRPPQAAYSLTHLEFTILRRGEEQSTDHNLFINSLTASISAGLGWLALHCSVTYEVGGKVSWKPMISSILVGSFTVLSAVFAAVCFFRSKKAKKDDLYSNVCATITSVLGAPTPTNGTTSPTPSPAPPPPRS